MPEYLLVFDLDKIHEYVFATGRLKEIRGSSKLMSELTEEKKICALLMRGSFVTDWKRAKAYIGGGAGKVVITANDEEHARQAADQLEAEVRTKTISGSLTAVVAPIRNGDFKTAVEEGDWLLRRRKGEKPTSIQLGMAPVTEFCQSCRSLPAEDRMDARDLCRSCLEKRRKADEIKSAGKNYVPEYLSQLAELGSPSNYIGFIHCDGNRMGDHLKRLDGTQARFTAFSDLVNRAVEEAAWESLSEVYPCLRDNTIPYDEVLKGGDDLIVITTADGAIDVAIKFCRKFQEKTRNGGHEVSMSAGVVLAHAHQPILQVQRRAKELLASAKQFSRQQAGEVGAIDFLVSSSPTLDNLSVLRAVEYEFEDRVSGSKVKHHLHRRPYTVGDLQDLVGWGRKIKFGVSSPDIPPLSRNKVNDIYRIFFQSKRRVQIEFDLLVSFMRLRNEHKKWVFDEIPTAFLGAAHAFWQPRKNPRSGLDEYYAVLPDIVELYEFIRRSP